jgi:hypothetical protein
VTTLDAAVVNRTLPVLLKNKRDIEKARTELELSGSVPPKSGQQE